MVSSMVSQLTVIWQKAMALHSRTDLLDKYGIDASSMKTLDDDRSCTGNYQRKRTRYHTIDLQLGKDDAV